MLPLDLLRVHTEKGRLYPIFADINSRNMKLASMLLRLFRSSLGKRKRDLFAEVANYESKGSDYRFLRGLSLILERQSIFQMDSALDPSVLRRLIFEESTRKGFITTTEKRKHVLRDIAKNLNISAECVEQSFYADLEDEMILGSFNSVDPVELLKLYNFSLTQTLLFRATHIEIKVSDHWKEILRAVKFRGLMYSAETANGVFKITVDGPLSHFKLTQRYGTNMAKTLPSILQAEHWEINGSIIRKSQYGKRLLQLRLTSTQVRDKIQTALKEPSSKVAFDSAVEEKFYRDFKSLNSGWNITREPTPLIAGKYVFIPDFSFEKRGITVYLEIAGFWTKNYLEKKIMKLQQLKGVELITAVNQQLACDKLTQIKGELIFYKKKVPLKPILSILKAKEEAQLHHEVQLMNIEHIHLEKDVVELQDLAKVLNVSIEALKRKLIGVELNGYKTTGELIIRQEKLGELEVKIASLSKPSLSQAINLIENEGIAHPYDILSALNYRILWNGLDSQKSSIYKEKN